MLYYLISSHAEAAVVIAAFLIGTAFGVGLTRYCIGLGTQIVFRIKDDLPLDAILSPAAQEHTADEIENA